MLFSDVRWGTQIATIILICFQCVAIWSTVPLTIRMFATIRDKRSLYFRATLASSWGLSLRSQAYLMGYYNRSIPWWIYGTLSQIGWILMVSGFALVLWSRLGLLFANERVKKYLLYLIIFNGIVWHTILTVFAMIMWDQRGPIFAARPTALYKRVRDVNEIFEYVQICFFNSQEILISSIYIYAAYVYLRDFSHLGSPSTRAKVRKAIVLLLIIQAIVVFIDAAVITIDLLGLSQLKGMINSFIYCVKLELEFLVLNQLIEISRMGVPGLPSSSPRNGGLDLEVPDIAEAPIAPTGPSERTRGRGEGENERDDAHARFGNGLKEQGVSIAQPISPSSSESDSSGRKTASYSIVRSEGS
ncbi:hypothetical protein BU24DRAFT_456016 [Aaosphaeria arxii CBS 175.79]|uniref:DUF7703 domain-containing protein n=1 Tax=Aaosphaeria arxii CBS 175.79 TaxID=1450172 RepID=A0A6A5X6V3_9PLEO|nr:uncharacterized protein BU24DRAFT_456016 [Aaosphaeria arxii CBS 175.79]KAF2008745.1 hypothetical protein BU24DRAFT_456016 [Aaosphaeria arxii CBS 175.79]